MKNEKKLILETIAGAQAAIDANPAKTEVGPVGKPVELFDVDAVNAMMPAGCRMVNRYGHMALTMPNGMIAKTASLPSLKEEVTKNYDPRPFGIRAQRNKMASKPYRYATLAPVHIRVMNVDAPCYDAINVTFQVQQVHDNLRTAQASGNAALIAAMLKQGEQLRDQVGAAAFRKAVLELAEAGTVKLDPAKVIEPTPLETVLAMAA